jgi:hypothetical protein
LFRFATVTPKNDIHEGDFDADGRHDRGIDVVVMEPRRHRNAGRIDFSFHHYRFVFVLMGSLDSDG